MSSNSRQGSVCKLCLDQKENYIQAGLRQLLRSHCWLLVGYLVQSQSQLMQTVPCRIQMCMWRVICRDLCGISWPMLSLLDHQWPRKVSCLWFSPSACHLRALASILVGGNEEAEQLISPERLEFWWLTLHTVDSLQTTLFVTQCSTSLDKSCWFITWSCRAYKRLCPQQRSLPGWSGLRGFQNRWGGFCWQRTMPACQRPFCRELFHKISV